MNKLEYIDFYKQRLPDTPVEGWDEDYIAFAIGMAFNQIIYDTFRKDLSNLDLYTKTYSADISQDSTTNIYYSQFPVNGIAQLPDPAEGIRRIMRGKASKIDQIDGIEFVPIKGNMHLVYDEDEIRQISNAIGYKVMNGRVEYRWMKPEVAEAGVRMDVVRTIDTYGDYEQVHIPSGKDQLILEIVLKMLSGQPYDDIVNDNNPKTK